MTKVQPAQSTEWYELRVKILREIDDLDSRTQYSPVEPKWWVEMMNVRALISKQIRDTNDH